MLKTLLIEIGVEELPAVPLLGELGNIEKKWAKVLEENALMCEFEFYYTPRRLVLWHREFKSAQDDTTEELFGAPVAIAFKEGKPTPAAEGFARKCGVSLDEVGRAEKGGKEVLYYKKEIKGQPSQALLEGMISQWLRSLSFGKSMRWGALEESFIRPIRWINVMMEGESVDMTLFNVKSAPVTYVHRMHSFEPQMVADEKQYFELLESGAVTLFADDRRKTILDAFEALEKEHGIAIEVDGDLLDEVIAITENPTPLLGSFDDTFLRLPPEVIITSMKEHQRYFPVFKDGKLVNQFVVVSNALTEDFSKVIEGNERVLRPRLADALFFYDNDLNKGLSTEGLEKVVFMDGLGTLRDKINREHDIADALFERYGDLVAAENSLSYEMNQELVQRAVELAKADLMSEMVYEFTELQGLMGYYYAQALGEADEVALAIKEQYLPEGEDSPVPSTRFSALVALAIKLDTLLGLFSVDQIPTGSRDPFGLRRAVNGIVRIALAHDLPFDIAATLRELGAKYEGIDFEKLESFFIERVNQYYKVNPSIVAAVLASGEREILSLDAKIKAVASFVESDSFSTMFSTFKRVANITKDFDVNGPLNIDLSRFEAVEEGALYKAFKAVVDAEYDSYEAELDALFGLKPQLDAFFDNVMVNAEDEAVRYNRKVLVASVYKTLLGIADIKEISI
ncbi:glycine--tRNA ligase subunit beta [Sulfurimonas diazotrophicus]|uniref:Glycine--tRNA ligase beta subunit n=1 Tax=Sulfurimonas diazotrophicus TaxID=3131939 RepID=A0ABZ3H744_9BACT